MNLYLDLESQKLVPGLSSTARVEVYTFVLRDVIPVSLYLLAPQVSVNAPYAVTEITAGHHLEFGAKAAPSDLTYLFSDFTFYHRGRGWSQLFVNAIHHPGGPGRYNRERNTMNILDERRGVA